MQRAICWIRRDLRLSDHAALAHATREAREVTVVFVFDRVILDALEDRDDRRLSFIHDALAEVDGHLREAGSKLIVLHGDPVKEIPALADRLGCEAVFTNQDTEPYAKQRDATVAKALSDQRREMRLSKDQVVFEGREVLGMSGEPIRVYTPYRKAWEARLEPLVHFEEQKVTEGRWIPASSVEVEPGLPTLEEIGFKRGNLWLASGESAARQRLVEFADHVDQYGEQRDFPAVNGTSWLSVHLRHGTISARECFRWAQRRQSAGLTKWWSELIWREFYQQILANFPHVAEYAFRTEFDSVEWVNDEEWFAAWCAGKTGFPLVDAAMRCLNATGWMHNRLRMVTASFLTKDLLIDYKWGEAYFARMLLDFDLASNNGGWQWAASTGCDPQPYFRIFNPILQSRKFDPVGMFIREWVPEIAHLDDNTIHAPWEQGIFGVDSATYPPPIVDHMVQKPLAISLLEAARATSAPA